MSALVLVLLKFPETGQVKTRLAADLGEDAALAAYRTMTAATLRQLYQAAGKLNFQVRFLISPWEKKTEMISWLREMWPEEPDILPQAGGDLGHRLQGGFTVAFAEEYNPVFAIGVDCPYIETEHFAAALTALETAEIVFGPTPDGGYYLLGMRDELHTACFDNIPWSDQLTLATTLYRLDQADNKYELIKSLSDIDTIEDWKYYTDMQENTPPPQPIRFDSIYQKKVWGGRQLETMFGRTLPDATAPYGEAWEISDRAEERSIVSGGRYIGKTLNDLWQNARTQIFGSAYTRNRWATSKEFPLLCKILDADEHLSVQVHPPVDQALKFGGQPKSEFWYVAHAEPDARLYIGLNAGIDREDFATAIANGTVADCIHTITPKTGESIYLPSGRLHAIGAGLVIFEIQQNSDTTYRVFDWNRLGLDGKPRDLHVDKSLTSIDFSDVEPAMTSATSEGMLAACDYFSVKKITLSQQEKTLSNLYKNDGCFRIAVCINGWLSICGDKFTNGDYFILPANISPDSEIDSEPNTELLIVKLPTL